MKTIRYNGNQIYLLIIMATPTISRSIQKLCITHHAYLIFAQIIRITAMIHVLSFKPRPGIWEISSGSINHLGTGENNLCETTFLCLQAQRHIFLAPSQKFTHNSLGHKHTTIEMRFSLYKQKGITNYTKVTCEIKKY